MSSELPLHLKIHATDRLQQVSIALDSKFKYTIHGDPTPQILKEIFEFIEGYFQGLSPPLPALEWGNLSLFTKGVLRELPSITFGQNCTYADLAKKIGNPKGCRAVGNALGRNPFPFFLPCHRVLAKNGWGGFSEGLDIKKFLVEFETDNSLYFN